MNPNESNTLGQLPSSVALPPFPNFNQGQQSSFSMPNFGGVLPFAANLLNMWFQGRQNRLNREFSSQQSELAWQRGLEQWYRESAYNSPSNQMRLLKQAGLNPNLAYDQSTTPAESPVYHPSQYQGIAPQMDPMSIAQANLLNSQADNLDADTRLKKLSSPGVQSESQMKGIQLLEMQKMYDAKVNMGGIIPHTMENGEVKYESYLGYWDAFQKMYEQEIQTYATKLDMEETQAMKLAVYMAKNGMTYDTKQLDIMKQEFDMNEKQLRILEKQVQDAEMAYNMLNSLDGAISKLDDPWRTLAYMAYFAMRAGSLPGLKFNF